MGNYISNNSKEPLTKLVTYFEDGKIQNEEYLKGKKRHRDGDKPALIVYDTNGKVKSEAWCKNGKVHRDGDKPSVIEYHETGTVKSRSWCKNGDFDRGDKPSVIHYDKLSNIVKEIWMTGTISHRIGKFAQIEYHPDSDFKERDNSFDVIEGKDNCRIEKWYYEGVLHNHNGPAIVYYKNDKKYREEYWKYGFIKRVENVFYPNGQIRTQYINLEEEN